MIFCGLGNPGPAYSATRHNMGFRAVDAMAREVKIAIEREKDEALYGRFVFKGEEHFLIKPLTFMNLSGRAVAKWLRRSSTPVEHLVVLYDDFDLSLGTLRIRRGGGAGTHNGMRSIVETLGTENFPRVRIGLKGPSSPEGSRWVDFVLSSLKEEEEKALEPVWEAMPGLLRSFLTQGVERTMNLFNKRRNPCPLPDEEATNP